MSSFDIKGKSAIVTGAGSGIGLALAQLLLEGGCSVILADLKLRPEAEAVVAKYKDGQTRAIFKQTDVSDWAQVSSLWETALEAFGKVNIVCNNAAILDPPASDFWNPPGVSPLARDKPNLSPGVYQTFAVNTMGTIRLAQIAIDYWLGNRHVEGNLLNVASVVAYVPGLLTPLYMASKAAVVSFTKCLAQLRKLWGIRTACICPGAIDTPIHHAEYCNDRLRPQDLSMSPRQCAEVMLDILQKPEYGDGSIMETMLYGRKEEPLFSLREVPLDALYSTIPTLEFSSGLAESEQKLIERLDSKGKAGL